MSAPDQPVVDLWYTQTAKACDDQLLDEYRRLLTTEELQQSERFVFDKHRRQYLVTRALVRTTLSHYTGIDPRHWVFQPDRYGKPHVAGPVDLALDDGEGDVDLDLSGIRQMPEDEGLDFDLGDAALGEDDDSSPT